MRDFLVLGECLKNRMQISNMMRLDIVLYDVCKSVYFRLYGKCFVFMSMFYLKIHVAKHFRALYLSF